ncbi:MAG: NfeD family protein [Deltaproteobacteria bacterium]|nr:NfeD family protein [Deltaproteobacteria bacterium]
MLSAALIWFLVGVAFLVSELMVPGFILVFFAAGSWVTALFTWQLDIGLTFQITIFVISSLVLLFALRKIGLKTFRGKALDNADERPTDAKIGRTAIVTQVITPNAPGEIKVMGSFWRATAETEIEAGVSVVVERQESEDGLTFRVKQISDHR